MTTEINVNPSNPLPIETGYLQPPVTITGLQNDVEYTVTIVAHLKNGFTMSETRKLKPSQFAVAAMTADQIRAMSTADIIALGTDISILNPEALGALSSTQLHAITTAQASSFSSFAIAALDCGAFNGLTTGSLHALTTSAVKGLTTCQTQTLDSADISALNSKVVNLSTDAISSLTSTQIPYLSTSQLAVLPNSSIAALTPSAVSGLTTAQVSSLSTANINALGTNVSNLNSSAINTLSTTQVTALTTAQVSAFDSADVAAMSTSSFNAMNYADLAALSSDAVAGITTDQVATLSANDITALGPDIANLSFDAMGSLTSSQFVALTSDQIGAFDVIDFAALSSDALSALTSTQAAGLTKEQIAAMSTSGFNALSTAALAGLTWDAVSGITAAQVDTLSTADIIALGTDIANLSTAAMASLDSAQFAALTTAQLAAFDSADIHALTSSAFDQLSTASLAALSWDAVAGITSEQVDTLSTTDIQALGTDIANMPTDAMASLDSTQLHALTTDQFAAFDRYDIAALSSTAIAGLTSAQIAAMSDLAFDAFSLADLGELSSDAVAGITPTQVDTLSTDDIQALGTDIANMGTAAMNSLDSNQLRALTPAQFAAFDATDISALSSDAVSGLTSEQVAALSTTAFSALTTAELAGLSFSAVAGITTAQIGTLDTADIAALGTDISNLSSAAMASLNSTQVGALSTAQISAFDTADIIALGTQIANLSSDAISKLTSTQIAALTTTQVAAFDSADIAAMSTDAFSALTTADLVALTSNAVAGITPTQVDTLNASEIQALGTDIANMGTAAMASLDSTQLQALTSSQFAAFDATDIAALSSTAISGLTSTQVAALSSTAFNAFTTEDLAELSFSAVAGITTAQVGTLVADDIKALGTDIANLSSSAMASLTSAQIEALENTQVTAFGTEDYSALGITGVTTTSMINLMQSVTAAKPSADVNSKTELQALSDAALYIMTVAALNSSTTLSSQLSTMPTFKAKLELLGVTGVTDQNIKAIWVAVRDSTDSGSSVDTLAKLQAITDVANDSPILLPSATARTYIEQASPVILNDDLILSDVDNANLVGATVTISSGYTADDLLAFTAANGITGSFSQPTLTLSGTATVAQYQTALRSVTFYSSSDNPTATSSSRTFTWQVDDGTTAGVTNLSDAATSTLNITAVNDAPVLANALVNQSATYNTPFTYTFASNTFTDVDSPSLSYTSTLANGSALPSWLTFTSNTRTFSGTPLDTTDLSVKVIASDGSLTANGTFTISMQPAIVSIAITGATGAQNGYVNAGDIVTSTVTFSEAVTVTGSPQLALNIGGTTVQATYNTGSGTSSLTFNYTILAGQTDTNGISIGANALTLNGGTIVDANSHTAIITSSAVSDNSSYKVDTTAPSITSVTPSWGSVLQYSEMSTNGTVTIVTTGAEDTTPASVVINNVTYSGTITSNSAVITIPYANYANLTNGNTYYINVTVTDLAGNSAINNTVSFSVDSTPSGFISILAGSHEMSWGMVMDSSHNKYIMGYGSNRTGLGYAPGESHAQLIKYNSSGVMQWHKDTGVIDANSYTYLTLRGFATDGSGNMYAVGQRFYSNNNTSTTYYDMIIIKVNSLGQYQWANQLGYTTAGVSNTTTSIFYGVAVDNSSNVYVVGISDVNETSTSYDIIIANYNSSGTLVWKKILDNTTNPPNDERGYSIAVNSSNNQVLLAGFSYSYKHAILICYNTSGTLQWQRFLTQTQYPYDSMSYMAVCVDTSNNIYTLGRIYELTGKMIVCKYNSAGVLQNQGSFTLANYSQREVMARIVVSGTTLFFAYGNSVGSINITTWSLNWINRITAGQYNAFYASDIKIDSDGNINLAGTFTDGGTVDIDSSSMSTVNLIGVLVLRSDGSQLGTYTVNQSPITSVTITNVSGVALTTTTFTDSAGDLSEITYTIPSTSVTMTTTDVTSSSSTNTTYI